MIKNKATIFIPVYNGEHDHLSETLTMVFNQKTDFPWNVLVIDSGSKDNSVRIVREFADKHKNLSIHEIPNVEYSHGATRQKAAEISNGEIMVYLSQDAVPANDSWLKNIIKPFDISKNVAGVLARQVPRSYCFPLQKQDINNVFNAQGVDGAVTVYDKESNDRGRAMFYSDVCSAARRDVLVGNVPYRSVSYAEDQAFGRDIINKGYIKAYTSIAYVNHSNDIRLSDYRGRILDEFLGLEESGATLKKPSLKRLAHELTVSAFRDACWSLKDSQYSKKQKLYYFITAPIFRLARWQGQALAFRHKNNHSLEKTKKTLKLP